MNINYKQSQFELFPGAANSADKIARPRFYFSSLTLSLENLVISSIGILMAIVLSFSMGVEKGKKVVLSGSPILPVTMAVSVSSKPAAVPMPQTSPANKTPDPLVNPSRNMPPEIARQDNKAEKTPVINKDDETPSSGYTIQVASFKKDEFAQKEADLLKKKGYNIFIVPKGKYSIVCVGSFPNKGDAKVTLNRLQKTYKDPIVRRL